MESEGYRIQKLEQNGIDLTTYISFPGKLLEYLCHFRSRCGNNSLSHTGFLLANQQSLDACDRHYSDHSKSAQWLDAFHSTNCWIVAATKYRIHERNRKPIKYRNDSRWNLFYPGLESFGISSIEVGKACIRKSHCIARLPVMCGFLTFYIILKSFNWDSSFLRKIEKSGGFAPGLFFVLSSFSRNVIEYFTVQVLWSKWLMNKIRKAFFSEVLLHIVINSSSKRYNRHIRIDFANLL